MIASTERQTRTPPGPADPGVIVIGAGMGGLAAALRLSVRGLPVTVIEMSESAGGKIRQRETSLGPIDLGPTVCTMRGVFEELLRGTGRSFGDLVAAEPLDVLAHHRWQDGSRLDLHEDPRRRRDALGRFAGAAELRRHDRFLAMARALYEALEAGYLHSAEPSLAQLLRRTGPAGWLALARAWPFASLWRRLGQCLRDPRLRQLYARYATYCGSSPMEAPATLMLIAHVEQAGVWRVRGGMGRLAAAVAETAGQRGVAFRFGERVTNIQVRNGRASGVTLASGERLAAQAVVVNGDVRDLQRGGFGTPLRGAARRRHVGKRSLSAVTWAGVCRLDDPELHHHNVVFSPDYPAEFDDLFGRLSLPRDPTVYLCAADRPRPPGAAEAPERAFLLINAPAIGDRPECSAERISDRAARRAQRRLAASGIEVELSDPGFEITTPAQFHDRYPATGGALYGSATHGWRSAFSRSGSRSLLPGLYLAGGSVHPGPGVPMAALSGLAAAECLAADLGAARSSTRRTYAHA